MLSGSGRWRRGGLLLEPEASVDWRGSTRSAAGRTPGARRDAAVAPLPVARLEHAGIHPTPDSTDTSFSSGKRWHTPPKISSVTQRMLSSKISDDTLAKFVIHPMPGGVLELRAHRAAADVEAHRDPRFLRGGPHRVPVRVRERWLTEVLRLVAEVHRPVAVADAALQLGNREVDVPERQRGHGDQPVRRDAAPVGEEVVVRAARSDIASSGSESVLKYPFPKPPTFG